MANLGCFTDVFSTRILAAVMQRDIGLLVPDYYVGISLAPMSGGTGAGLLEPTQTEYSRVQVAASPGNWGTLGVDSRKLTNLVNVSFAQAVTAWGDAQCYTLHDSLTGGILLGYGMIYPYTISAGTTAQFQPGSIVFSSPIPF